jgi:hypothetical protein
VEVRSEGVGGKGGWSLAAFVAGVSPDNKPAVTAWLREHGLLLEKRKAAHGTAKQQRGEILREHVYTDADGNPLAKKIRWGSHDPQQDARLKHFSWQRWEGEKWVNGLDEGGQRGLPLYRLPQIKDSPWVLVTEGEHDADAGANLGLPTTTGAAGSWREDHAECLRGRDYHRTSRRREGPNGWADKGRFTLWQGYQCEGLRDSRRDGFGGSGPKQNLE